MFPSLNQCFLELKAESFVKHIQEEDWNRIQSLMPFPFPSFIAKSEYSAAAEFAAIPEEGMKALDRYVHILVSNKNLLAFFWYLYWKMYLGTERLTAEQGFDLPDLDFSGEDSGVFYLLLALGMIPEMRAWHHKLGIPEEITRNTALELQAFFGNYKRGSNGRCGLYASQLSWLQSYIHGGLLFRIGRLEFRLKRYERDDITVFRNQETSQVVALASSANLFTSEGFCDAPSARHADENYWPAPYYEDENFVKAFPAHPSGKLLRKQICLDKCVWKKLMDKTSWILDMHIPAGGGMSEEICRNSFVEAQNFFAKYFPNVKIAAVNCFSWIFSPDLDLILPPDANLVKFANSCYRYPVASRKMEGIWFFFFKRVFDPLTVPRDTSLQKAVAEHLEKGGSLRSSGMFFLYDDMKNFAGRFYYPKFPENLLV